MFTLAATGGSPKMFEAIQPYIVGAFVVFAYMCFFYVSIPKDHKAVNDGNLSAIFFILNAILFAVI